MDTLILAITILILAVAMQAVIIRSEREAVAIDAKRMSALWHKLGWALRAAAVLLVFLSEGYLYAGIALGFTLITWDGIYNLIVSKGKKLFGLGTTSWWDIKRTQLRLWMKSIWAKTVGKKS